MSIGGRHPSALLVGAALTSTLLLGGCGGDGGATSESATSDTSPAKTEPAADAGADADGGDSDETGSDDSASLADAPRGAAHGVVRFATDPDARPVIDMAADPWCTDQHPGGIRVDDLVVNDGMLANAFVWIDDDFGGMAFDVPDEPHVVDQVDCMYEPRISGCRLGQTVLAKNSDEVLHNVHTKPNINREQNFAMPEGSDPREVRLRREEVLVEFACDVHPWMTAYVGVLDHPFFAVTDADGSWSFDDVPEGTYTVKVWHEVAGQKSFELTVAGNDDTDAGEVVMGGA